MMCNSQIISWDMKTRTCYSCPNCQVLVKDENVVGNDIIIDPKQKAAIDSAGVSKVFMSHCAKDYFDQDSPPPPGKMYVKDIRNELKQIFNLDSAGSKAEISSRLEKARLAAKTASKEIATKAKDVDALEKQYGGMTSAVQAAKEKLSAGEKASVEHVALADDFTVKAMESKKSSKLRKESTDAKRTSKRKGPTVIDTTMKQRKSTRSAQQK